MGLFKKNNKKFVIRLFGLGGNFKTSIVNSKQFEDYTIIPEFNREYDQQLSRFKHFSNPVYNICAKTILIKNLLSTDSDKFITDRSIIDYGITNYLIENVLDHYYGAHCNDLTLQDAIDLENDLYRNCKTRDFLLITKDLDFIKKIIDDSTDERGTFYDNYEYYLEAQEVYKNIILDNFPDTIVIENKLVPKEVHKLIRDNIKFIKDNI